MEEVFLNVAQDDPSIVSDRASSGPGLKHGLAKVWHSADIRGSGLGFLGRWCGELAFHTPCRSEACKQRAREGSGGVVRCVGGAVGRAALGWVCCKKRLARLCWSAAKDRYRMQEAGEGGWVQARSRLVALWCMYRVQDAVVVWTEEGGGYDENGARGGRRATAVFGARTTARKTQSPAVLCGERGSTEARDSKREARCSCCDGRRQMTPGRPPALGTLFETVRHEHSHRAAAPTHAPPIATATIGVHTTHIDCLAPC